MDSNTVTDDEALRQTIKAFHGDGFFHWQFSDPVHRERWNDWHYDEQRYWGGFSRVPHDPARPLPAWAIGPFGKYAANPVLSPEPEGWDCGHFGGGVHNGSALVVGDRVHYLYRGEFPLPADERFAAHRASGFDYLCDVGLAVSDDGIIFRRVGGPFLRRPEDWAYSFEDVNCVRHAGRYHLFLNRWDWRNRGDPAVNGIYHAVSDDLIHWQHLGLVFPGATRIHRNPAVVQDADNIAVRDARGRFVMYINNGLIAYSDDLMHWESREIPAVWPGGECAVAIAGHDPARPDDLVLLTGGNHTGHFYAIGEVLFSRNDPETPREWLQRPVLSADAAIPYEDGLAATPPHQPVSYWRDTVFLCGLTRFRGKWHAYYGGSEYYTCLATAPVATPG